MDIIAACQNIGLVGLVLVVSTEVLRYAIDRDREYLHRDDSVTDDT